MDQNAAPRTILEAEPPVFDCFENGLDVLEELRSFANQPSLYELASADSGSIHYELGDLKAALYNNNRLLLSTSLAESAFPQNCHVSDLISEITDSEKTAGNGSNDTGMTTSSGLPTDSLCTGRVKGRNGRAPSNVNIRKRDKERKLESTKKGIEKANRDLSTYVQDLTRQVHRLKMDLLQHADCDCVLIQKYVASEARRYVSGYQGAQSHQ
ncbi:hypothetical protein ACHAPU_009509 [Fusarium lateritium]